MQNNKDKKEYLCFLCNNTDEISCNINMPINQVQKCEDELINKEILYVYDNIRFFDYYKCNIPKKQLNNYLSNFKTYTSNNIKYANITGKISRYEFNKFVKSLKETV